jgi:hypothetical protein
MPTSCICSPRNGRRIFTPARRHKRAVKELVASHKQYSSCGRQNECHDQPINSVSNVASTRQLKISPMVPETLNHMIFTFSLLCFIAKSGRSSCKDGKSTKQELLDVRMDCLVNAEERATSKTKRHDQGTRTAGRNRISIFKRHHARSSCSAANQQKTA